MKYEINDLVNKYVDNQLSRNELDYVEDLLKNDDKFTSVIKVHKYVHNTLTEMPVKLAPVGFTEQLMEQIKELVIDKYKKNYWFRGVLAILGSFLVLTLFVFFYFLGDLAIVNKISSTSNNYAEKILPTISYFTQLVKTDVFKSVTGLIGFIILIGFYFNFNSHKEITERLKKY